MDSIKYWGYAKLGLKPSELYDLDLPILGDMIHAHIKLEEEILDKEMMLLSWQTSLLMNSTGNYKKKIKPDDLYTPLETQREKAKIQAEGFNPKKRQELQNELLSAFADSDIVVQ